MPKDFAQLKADILDVRQSTAYKTVYAAADFEDGCKEALLALLDKFGSERLIFWLNEVREGKVKP